jgi:hypothetical protein
MLLVCRYAGADLGMPMAPLTPAVLLGLAVARSARAVPVRRPVWRMTRPVVDVCGATGMLHGWVWVIGRFVLPQISS